MFEFCPTCHLVKLTCITYVYAGIWQSIDVCDTIIMSVLKMQYLHTEKGGSGVPIVF